MMDPIGPIVSPLVTLFTNTTTTEKHGYVNETERIQTSLNTKGQYQVKDVSKLNSTSKTTPTNQEDVPTPDPGSDAYVAFANRIISGHQGNFQELIAYTDNSTDYISTEDVYAMGHMRVHCYENGKTYVPFKFQVQEYQVQSEPKMFKHHVGEYNPKLESLVLDVDAQKKLLAAGIDHVGNIPIPPDPKEPLSTGGTRVHAGSIVDTGIFAEGHGTTVGETDFDRRYFVKTRVPDTVDYHYERQKNDNTIPFLEKFHAQYQRPLSMTDKEFENELAHARYLSGMVPYLSNHEAKEFEHFTYWRYKNIPKADIYRGAYIHIFISRPDLHLLDRIDTASTLHFRDDVIGNRELNSLIFMNPEGAMSLVQRWQTHARTDINLFLSNRACGISLSNESLDDHSFVENYTRIKTAFGGRMDNQDGEIELTFNETDDLSVSNTILLWMKYIHATYTGILSPLCKAGDAPKIKANDYYINHMHPMWRRLDSASSIYVIATDMTQRNIIFWRKYFGTYPKSSTHSGLGMEDGKLSEGSRKITVPFKYTTFRTNNLADLYAFNRLSDLQGTKSGYWREFQHDMYQTRDPSTVQDHDLIAGLPFVALEQHLTNIVDNYNTSLPQKMLRPQLLFTRSDGAFLENGDESNLHRWVNRYWGGDIDNSVSGPNKNNIVVGGGGDTKAVLY